MALKLRRGLEEDRLDITPAEGEIIYTTDQKQLFVGDGTTAGGTLVSAGVTSVNGISGSSVVLTTDDIDEGTTNLYYSDLYARAAISVTGSGGSYEPSTGVITLTGGGAGTTYGISAETATGGVNLRLTGSNATTDDVKLAQGSNITLTRTDANTITIASTASSSVENLDDLLDVDAASPSDGQALVWNSGSTSWRAANVGSGTVASAIINQLAFYTNTNTVGGNEKITIDQDTGDLFISGLYSLYAVLQSDGNFTPSVTLAKYHNGREDNAITMVRGRGDRTAPEAVQFFDSLGKIESFAHDGVNTVGAASIETYVTGAITNGVAAFEATLSTGTAIVTLTEGDTTGLVEGQYISKQSGVGEFGFTSWSSSPPYIVSVDGPTQLTLNINHAVAGAVVFDISGIIPTTVAVTSTSVGGRQRQVLKVDSDHGVTVGPSLGDYDGVDFTGRFRVTSMKSPEVAVGPLYSLADSAVKLGAIFDGVPGQEIAFTRIRGTVEQGGAIISTATVQTGDELGSLGFYGYNAGIPGIDNLLSSRIISEATGTITSTAMPGKIRLQTANASGSIGDVLALTSTSATFSTRAFFAAGTEAAPGITFDADGSKDTGLWHAGDGIICVSINANEKVRVDTGGMRVDGFMKVKDFGSDPLPNPPEAGMIVLQGGTFQGYNGSAWVLLG
jgi:hypothetical protein